MYAIGLLVQPPTERGKRERVREICKQHTISIVYTLCVVVCSAAEFFRQNPACTHRLVPWLTREFRVLLGPEHIKFMIQLVLSLIDK